MPNGNGLGLTHLEDNPPSDWGQVRKNHGNVSVADLVVEFIDKGGRLQRRGFTDPVQYSRFVLQNGHKGISLYKRVLT